MVKKKQNKSLEARLWDAADQLRANSELKSSQYSKPVLGLIFLRFADFKFSQVDKNVQEKKADRAGASVVRDREYGPSYYQSKGIMYIPKEARYDYLLNLPEGEKLGKAINEAMKAIEKENPDLKGILPKTYTKIEDDLLVGILKNFSEIPMDVEGDMFGKIYEYFLGKFAMAEGQGGGEFFTPRSLVKLIVEILEPFEGKIFDPACGSGGMFVQSADFIEKHKKNGEGASELMSIYGQEKTLETAQLAKLNIAVHGLSGDIKQANTMYEDSHKCMNKFDFVMANPPFNVKGVDRDKIKDDPRYSNGIPTTNNANYLWIQIFANCLNETGRSGFVMANSASDARNTELEIRRKLIEEDQIVDIKIAIGPNMFYTVVLPVTLWFFDKDKRNTDRKDSVLFIDARNIYRQIDSSHRELTDEQIGYISAIAKLYRGEKIDFLKYIAGQKDLLENKVLVDEVEEKQLEYRKENILEIEQLWKDNFKKGYEDVAGLCKVATVEEIKEQGYSLNPGRYVGVAESAEEDEDFGESMNNLNTEFQELTEESHKLEEKIVKNMKKLDLE